MIKVKNIETWGFEHSIRGMRNPKNSWGKSDSKYIHPEPKYRPTTARFVIEENDLKLMKQLYTAGTEHRKYLRQIIVSMDITAPLYWWKEFDTYKVGTTANSCSTMHKIHSKRVTIDDFSYEHLLDNEYVILDGFFQDHATKEKVFANMNVDIGMSPLHGLEVLIQLLNYNRNEFLKTKDKKYWWQMIQLLPSSYNQKRTITMNYENVFSMIKQRTRHKLDEWNEFVSILKELPYVKEIGGFENELQP